MFRGPDDLLSTLRILTETLVRALAKASTRQLFLARKWTQLLALQVGAGVMRLEAGRRERLRMQFAGEGQ